MAKQIRYRTRFTSRFEMYVDQSAGPDKCWEWRGLKNNYGYGKLYMGPDASPRERVATHIAWFLKYGEWPKEFVCHHCDNPGCVNPQHLWQGKQKENAADMVAKGRSTFGEKHGGSKLTEAQVLAIRQDTRSQKEIANDYGVNPSTISRLRAGKRWTYLDAVTH